MRKNYHSEKNNISLQQKLRISTRKIKRTNANKAMKKEKNVSTGTIKNGMIETDFNFHNWFLSYIDKD